MYVLCACVRVCMTLPPAHMFGIALPSTRWIRLLLRVQLVVCGLVTC